MERFVKLLGLVLLFSMVLYTGFLCVLLVAIGADSMKLETYKQIGFSVFTGIAFLWPLSLIGKIIWREMK